MRVVGIFISSYIKWDGCPIPFCLLLKVLCRGHFRRVVKEQYQIRFCFLNVRGNRLRERALVNRVQLRARLRQIRRKRTGKAIPHQQHPLVIRRLVIHDMAKAIIAANVARVGVVSVQVFLFEHFGHKQRVDIVAAAVYALIRDCQRKICGIVWCDDREVIQPSVHRADALALTAKKQFG